MKTQLAIKRIFDFTCAFLIIVLFFPIWFVVATAIKVTSPGSVFFLQDRPGREKKIFKIYKFRTMKTGSEHMIKGQEVANNDVRITRFGRFLRRSKIDEIPQLFNVLRGEMSLVGPRPERVDSLQDYDSEISKRLNMRPGMTGLSQVSGNIYLTLSERYILDVYYVEHFNLWLDIKIYIRTIGVVLFGEGRFINCPLVNVNAPHRIVS